MMATRIKPAPKELYEEDFYVWAQRQAELLRARRYDELDLEHLIEEVEDLGGAVRRSVRSRVPHDIEHLLKLQHSPAVDPRRVGATPSGRSGMICWTTLPRPYAGN